MPCPTAYCNVDREYTAHAISRMRNIHISIGISTRVNSNISDPRCLCLRERDGLLSWLSTAGRLEFSVIL